MAGLDGDPEQDSSREPLDKDIYELAPEELAKVPKAPGSLDEAARESGARPRSSALPKATCSPRTVIDTVASFKPGPRKSIRCVSAASV